jgi:protein O-GlcNAc transferase
MTTDALTINQALEQAIAHHRAGELPQAEQLYQAILQVEPTHADANHNLGVLATQVNKTAEALPFFKTAIESNPRPAKFWFSYLDALIQENQVDTAISVLKQGQMLGLKGEKTDHFAARLAMPTPAEIETLQAYFAQRDYAQAETLARDLIRRFPYQGVAWKFLGIVLQATGRLDESLAAKEHAVALLPNDADALFNLGNSLKSLGRFREAAEKYQQALARNSNDAAIYNNLGTVQQELGDLNAAVSSYQQAIALNPQGVDAYNNLACCFKDLGRVAEAESAYRHAIALAPDYVEARNNLGILLQDSNRFQEAEACYRQALQIQPNLATTYGNLGRLLRELSHFDEAETAFRTALMLEPTLSQMHSNLLFAHSYRADRSPAFLLADAQQYGAAVAKKVRQKFSIWACEPQPARLRVGLVSGDLCHHPVSYFLENLLTNLADSRLELLAYSNSTKADEVTARLKPYFADWKSLIGLNDEAAAQLIHRDAVAILIDLSGHTAENRLPLFAWKPAPVQISWLGYWATTGVAEMDYLLADKVGVPVENQAHFTEQIRYLPDTRLCFSAPKETFAVSELPALSTGYITFACFQNLNKVTDAVLAVWGEIFARLPTARLYFQSKQLDDAHVVETLYARLARYGIAAERVRTQGFTNRATYLAVYAQVDFCLDTFPYTGGTTTCEALWMGVPTLTLAGETLIARQGASLLSAAGLPEWIVENEQDYIKQAIDFATDLDYLAQLRSQLRQQVLASPLFDGARFARHFEAVLWECWQERKAALGDSFAIP